MVELGHSFYYAFFIKYDIIKMGNNKMGSDIYIDDRAVRPEEL